MLFSETASKTHGEKIQLFENEQLNLEFSYVDNVFQVNFNGGVHHRVYPVDDHRIMDSYSKDYKFEVTGDEDNLSIDVYIYYNGINRYKKFSTYYE